MASGFFLLDFLVPLFAVSFCASMLKGNCFSSGLLYLLYLLHLFAVGAAEGLALPGSSGKMFSATFLLLAFSSETCLLSLRSKRCPCRSDEADPKRCLT